MNIKESRGEPSHKRQENGDDSTSPERPLKKARFAWQVKGKYHLKNDSSENSTPTLASEPDKPSSSSQKQSTIGNTEQNLEILGDYLMKQDFNTFDSAIADSDKSLLKPSSSLSSEKLEYPRYVSSVENNSPRTYSNARTDKTLVPMSMVATRSFNEEQCIARWQAKQMAKGFVDNTINRVLDSWMIAPLPADMDDNRFLALDVAEFINNLPGDNSIENEGILMAISAHGLQNNSNSSSNNESNANGQGARSSDSRRDFQPRSSSPTEDETECNRKRQQRSFEMAWTHEDETEMTNPHAPFSLFPEDGQLHYDNDNQNSEFDDSNSNNNDLLSSHYDFMDAAVSFVIQNQGLTSFGSDYG